VRRVTQSLPIPRTAALKLLDFSRISQIAEPVRVSSRRPLPRFTVEIHDVHEFSQQAIFFFGYYEIRESLYCWRTLDEGDLFIDVGAHLGWFSLLASSLIGPRGRVVAFEPSSLMRARLQSNVELNGSANVLVSNLALSNAKGTRRLHGGQTEHLGLLTIESGFREIGDVAAETVEVTTFDDWWVNNGRLQIDLMKVDVEGHEIAVMKGATEALSAGSIREMILEVSTSREPDVGYGPAEILGFLREFDGEFYRLGWGRPQVLREGQVLEGNILVRFPGSK